MKKKKKKKKTKSCSFSNPDLCDLLSDVFRKNPTKLFNYKQLSKILKIKEMGVKMQLVGVLKTMSENGAIAEERRGSYRLSKKTTVITSTIKNTHKKGVYADIDNENEVFIPKEFSQFSLSGDEVEILLFSKRKNKQEGEVVSVLKRKKNTFVGVIDGSSGNYFLIPDDKKIVFDVFLPPKSIKKSFLKKKVVVKVKCWDNKYKNPVGEVVSVIGKINDHNTEIYSILYDHGFAADFPKEAGQEVEKIKEKIPRSEINSRLDFRKTPTFTIDPEDAKDFDDAISVKSLSKGRWEIGVHIADVSYYVKPGGHIDKEAKNRSTSVYLVDRVVPMLPEVLSNNLCSLKPKVDRLAYSVIFEMDERACVFNYMIRKTVIHSDFRFSYKGAQEVIDNKKGVFASELLALDRVSKVLRKKRQENGSINFENSEAQFVLDNNNNPVDVFLKPLLSTNRLIEEFMLLANKTVAKHVGFPEKGAKAFVYRVHDLPNNEKIVSLNSIIKKLGYSIDKKRAESLSSSLNTLLQNVKGKKEQQMVETLAVRSMAKAVYSTDNIGHYGLAFKYYSHFTSPIRRYPDLIVHRLLYSYSKKQGSAEKEDVEKLCRSCSEKERSAALAERDSIKFMQVKFLKNSVGVVFDGVISGVADWGLYVELLENKCEGLVKVGSMKNDHFIFDKKTHTLTGFQTKVCYQLGQKVKIEVQKASLEKRQLDFILV